MHELRLRRRQYAASRGRLTHDDLAKAASDAGVDPETVADNIHAAAKQARDGGSTE